MRVIVCEDYNELSAQAARLVASQLILNPNSVLGLATGSTPVGMYRHLVSMNRRGDIDFSDVTTFNLDEYYPISPDSPQSYRYFMNEQLFSKVNIDINNTFVPNGMTDDPEKECLDYEKNIEAHGGIDLQILGIGRNGHIGFNEPGANLNSATHLTELSESTVDANSRFFDSEDDVPRRAITMGIASILKSKKIILLASGASKSRVVSELLDEDINTSVPATLLKVHPDVVLICDKDAYSGTRLGVDIGGTNVKFAVVEGRKLIYKSSIRTEKASADMLISSIADECNRLKKLYPVKTVGVGTPGIIKDGRVNAANLPFRSTPLGAALSKLVDMPVTVDNDANCAALGESEFGAGKKYQNIIMITLGTGIGGGIIFDGSIAHGKSSMGEIGHIIIKADGGRPCPCGQHGCWEQYASVSALIASAKEAVRDEPDSLLSKLATEKGRLDGEAVFDAYEKGCKVAAKLLEKYTHYLAVGITSLINVFGPDAVILAGGITSRGNLLIPMLLPKIPSSDVAIEISTLENDAGSLGAALL